MSIVVLPFANLSGDPEQRYFADGLVDDLTTDLSRIDSMFVISRNTAFTYKDMAVDAKQISQELGVRYVLEGSVRRSGSQLRVNAQLIDAEIGVHLWAERFGGDIGDLFALQSEITSRIAAALDIELVGAEAARPTEHPDALDYMLRGRAASWRSPTAEKYAHAIGLFDAALALDPHSVEARSLLAAALANRVLDRMTETAAGDLARAKSLIAQALLAEPLNPRVHYARAELLRVVRHNQEAIPEYEMAIAGIATGQMPLPASAGASSGSDLSRKPLPGTRKPCGSVRVIRLSATGTIGSGSSAFCNRAPARRSAGSSERAGRSPAFPSSTLSLVLLTRSTAILNAVSRCSPKLIG